MRVAFIEPSIANVKPLGIAYLAQSLVNDGHEVKYFESPRAHFLKRLKDFNPDILAFSVTTGKHASCRNLNSVLRNHIDAISLFGGPHCTFYPEFIESNELIDGICRGEGEYAIAELLKKIESGGDYLRTANWWLRVGGKIHKNGVRVKIENLDTLPFPNQEIIYAENPDLRDTPIKRILASRGCPFDCSYCFNKKYNALYQGKGEIYRQRSSLNVVQEICETREKYPLTFVKFIDDTFGLRMDYEEFARVYKKEVGIPFSCILRPNLINAEKIKLLKNAGCVAVTLAIESASETIRNTLLNRNLPSVVLSNAISILKSEGVRIHTQNIIANPGETFEMAMETFDFNAQYMVDFAECFLLNPYPGTDIYQYCVENNYFGGEIDTLQKSYWLGSHIRFDSKREKRRLINFQKFFSFGVQHPKTLPIIKLLIELPPNNLFVLFNRLYDSLRLSRFLKAKFSVHSYLVTARNNLRYITSCFLNRKEKLS
ncbi:MAG: B12-binding domain-containing radical SAM protein [Deltaproteobacteria bacterium]|nr:B12-binding domain-containing radical SAM protein [Deltaproteobacteria bacterium]